MSQPLGNTIGNWLEVKESIECLKGNGPDDLEELTLTLGAHMLTLGGISETLEEAHSTLKSLIQNGAGLNKFIELVEAQEGDSSVITEPEKYPPAEHSAEVIAESSGYVESIDSYALGSASVSLGAGRIKIEDDLDHKAGIILNMKIGDSVKKGDVLMEIFSGSNDKLISQQSRIKEAITVSETEPQIPGLIIEVI